MRAWRVWAASAVVGVVVGVPATAISSPSYPVPWTFAAAVPAGAVNGPDVAPPGANTACRPSSAHPEPVVLVHGLFADQSDNWQTIAPFLADNGYCVYSLTYGNDASGQPPFDRFGGLADMAVSAQELAAFVDHVLAETGAAKVDIVGHSEGGTMPDYYLKALGGAAKVDHFVALSGVLHGTTFWGLSTLYALGAAYGYSQQFSTGVAQFCTSCLEFLSGSSFMQQLDAPTPGSCPYDGAAVDGVRYTSIATDNDELVRPPTSDFIDPRCNGFDGIGVDDILVQQQCPLDQADHLSIAADPVVGEDILNALQPGRDGPVPCVLVLPAVG